MATRQDIQRLLNDEHFQRIEERLGQPNLFLIAGMGSWEIKHSNFIAWVLDPNESHGLGDAFIKAIISRLCEKCATDAEREKLSSLLEDDLCDAVVVRERERNIDLLFKTNDDRFVLCIENKVWFDASDTQLDKYYEYVEGRYRKHDTKLFAFLTPDGRKVPKKKADSHDSWLSLSYENLAGCLRQLLPLTEDKKVQMLITDYLDLLERMGIVVNENMAGEIDQLYLDHKDVFDLVFQRQRKIRNIISNHLKGIYIDALEEMRDEGILRDCISAENAGMYLWFTTKAMDDLLDTRSDGLGSWGSESNPYSYWVYPGPDGLLNPSIQLELGPLNQPQQTIEKMNELREFFAPGRKGVESTQQYRRIWGEQTGIDGHSATSIDEIDDIVIKESIRNAILRMLKKEREFFDQR